VALCSLVRQLALSADGDAVQHALMQLYPERHKHGFAAKQLRDSAPSSYCATSSTHIR
jgi:hypothetical protein